MFKLVKFFDFFSYTLIGNLNSLIKNRENIEKKEISLETIRSAIKISESQAMNIIKTKLEVLNFIKQDKETKLSENAKKRIEEVFESDVMNRNDF